MHFSRSLALALALVSLSGISALAQDTDATVARHTDGDTTRFQIDGQSVSVRWEGIDAPELHLPVSGGGSVAQSPWGEESLAFLERQIPVGTRVSIHEWGTDVYHRTLGTMYLGSADLNYQMVHEGWALPFPYCSEKEDCDGGFLERHAVARYAEACASARSAGKGIFNPANPLTEEPYVFRARMSGGTNHYYIGDVRSRRLYGPSEMDRVDACYRVFFTSRKAAQAAGF